MRNLRSALLVAAAAVALASCGSKDEEAGKKGQVVASVNGEELTIHQLNARLQGVQMPPGVDPKVVQRQALDTLIDEEVLVQKATEANMDRDPQVMQRLDQARRGVLAQSYLQREIGTIAPPAADAVRKFYNDNPGLFSDRRRYALAEIAARPTNAAAGKAYQDYFNGEGSSLAGLMARLKADKVQGAAGTSVRNAEDLPLQIVPVFAKMKVGDKAFYQTGPVLHFIEVRNIQDSPIDFERAKPRIDAFLRQQTQAKAIRDKVAALKKGAKIEYKSDFAAAATPATAAPATKAAEKAAVDRGVEGLR